MSEPVLSRGDLERRLQAAEADLAASFPELGKLKKDLEAAKNEAEYWRREAQRESLGGIYRTAGEDRSQSKAEERGNAIRRRIEAMEKEAEPKVRAVEDARDELETRKRNPIKPAVDFFDAADEADKARTWLVEGFLVSGEACLMAGPRKALKTTLALDLALSLATGTPFLGRHVPRPVRVLFMSGESGLPTLVEAARRIAATKGLKPADLAALDTMRWSEDLPVPHVPLGFDKYRVDLGNDSFTQHLGDWPPDVVILDPLYMLINRHGGLNMADLTSVGPALSALVAACETATPIILHHATKDLYPGKPMILEDAAQAGIAEFARQWILLNRRRPFVSDPERDRHQLLLSYGGSAGHNGCLALDIDEGKQRDDFTGRTWKPSVLSLEEAKEADAEARKAKAAAKATGRRDNHAARLWDALPADGSRVSFSIARKLSGLNTESMKAALAASAGRIEETKPGRSRLLRRAG
jgi:hypothetical protein